MMKASELQKQIRIGNYLLGKCIDDLDDRKEWWEIYKIQDAEHLMAVKEDWDKPIELTEEILLKCGFKKLGSVFCISERCVVDASENRISFYIDRIEEDIDLDLPKHLHQLQNLYFALTNEELEIKL